jgi:hypothetical protein
MLDQLAAMATGILVLIAYAILTAALFIAANFIRLGGIRAGIARLNNYNSKEIN